MRDHGRPVSAVTTPPATQPPLGGPPPGSVPPEPPRRRWWMARRFLFAGLGIALLSGGASYKLVRGEISTVVAALHQNKAVKVAKTVLAPTSQGQPETLLLVGNDERKPPRYRPGTAVEPHSNEMLLVRIDPSQPTISMLSIPRELRVTFTAPNGAVITNRINSAYTYGYEDGGGVSGGVKLMVETIKRVLGIPVINHVFVTNFKRFENAVNEMGCVYMTVDKRYFHSNSEPGAEQYFEINLKPGYQQLCGKQALEFVANRHESTSLIRDARDQRFLLDVKAQYGSTLFGNRDKFERIFGKAVETDLHGEEEVLQLLELAAEAAGKPVRQVPFHVTLLPSEDIASPQQLEAAAHSFLAGTAAVSLHKLHPSSHHSSHSHRASPPPSLDLSPTPVSALEQARSMAPELPFAVEAPRFQKTTAEAAADEMRHYTIRGPGHPAFPAYVIVVDEGELGQYYDIEGSTWTNPPVLSNPTERLHLGARTYSLFYDGEHMKTIAWREANATYWIENTLTYGLTPEAMVAIARETRSVVNTTPSASAPGAAPHRFTPPPPGLAPTSLGSKVAVVVAFLSFVILALLAMLLLSRQRQLIRLREQVAHALALEAHQRPLLAASGIAGETDVPGSDPAPTIYRVQRRPRPVVLAAGTALLAVVAAVVILHLAH